MPKNVQNIPFLNSVALVGKVLISVERLMVFQHISLRKGLTKLDFFFFLIKLVPCLEQPELFTHNGREIPCVWWFNYLLLA